MSENDLEKESAEITEKLTTLDQWKNSASIMLFVSLKDEPNTSSLIKKALAGGKRVIVPYCKDKSGAMGISEIKDPLKDLVEGNYGIQEPKKELRDNFFTSDIRLIICPGVAFGKDLSRLGRGKGYYDRFLKNLSGKIPTIGLGYSCQLKEEPIPFDYHDVMMDTIVTPNDIIIRNNS
jgi:5-formyltetrahydrofolate cyclo-ligase